MNDWGCPDWSDASAYPASPDELTNWQWRWAFLRRFPKYRDLWSEHNKQRTEQQSPFILWSGESQVRYAHEFGRHDLIDPEISEIDSGFNFASSDGYVQILTGWVNNPDISQREAEKEALNQHKLNQLLQDNGIFTVSFDVSRPLRPQLDRAELSLKQTQETFGSKAPQFKNRRDGWVRHLRVIDAKDQKATHEEFFSQWAKDETGGDDDKMDQYYCDHKNPRASVSQWHKQATLVMEKASRLL